MRLAQSLRILAWRPIFIAVALLTVAVTSACGQTAASPTPTAPAASTVAAPPPAAASPQRPALASPAPSPAVAAATASPGSSSSAEGEQTYEVKAGDTLLSISEEVYGDATKWRKIYDANKDAIGADPDKLKLEMKLKIPPKDS
jgi:5'-nucleotidase / UDP-sugar diphosphatase